MLTADIIVMLGHICSHYAQQDVSTSWLEMMAFHISYQPLSAYLQVSIHTDQHFCIFGSLLRQNS